MDASVALGAAVTHALQEILEGVMRLVEVVREYVSDAGRNARGDLAAGQQLDEIRASLDNSLSYYGDMVINVARDFSDAEVQTALEVVDEEFRLKQNAYLIPYTAVFTEHMRAYRTKGQADKDVWVEDLSRTIEN